MVSRKKNKKVHLKEKTVMNAESRTHRARYGKREGTVVDREVQCETYLPDTRHLIFLNSGHKKRDLLSLLQESVLVEGD